MSRCVTSLQSPFHFDLLRHPPVTRRMPTGLSGNQTTPVATCFVGGRREKPGRGPAHLSLTLRPRGPSGFCEPGAGACWGRTWCGRPGRRCCRWISSRDPSWVSIPLETPRVLQGLRCTPTLASRAQAHLAFVGISDHPHWTAPQMKDPILPIRGEDISQGFPAHLQTRVQIRRSQRDRLQSNMGTNEVWLTHQKSWI